MAAAEGVNLVEPVGTAVAEQVFGEMEPHAALVEFRRFALVAVALPGQDDEVEVFACLNQGVRHAERVAGVDVVVHVARHEQEEIILEFRDSGPGIDEAILPNLLDPFFTTKDDGTGLGLPIVQSIIASHGGQLHLANAAEGGAVVTVSLPAAPCPPQRGEGPADAASKENA